MQDRQRAVDLLVRRRHRRHEPVDIARRPNPARGGRRMYGIMLGVDDRSVGNALCARLRRAGGACMVVRK